MASDRLSPSIRIALVIGILVALLTGCASAPEASAPNEPVTVRIGYFPNITHSQALIGVPRGDFQDALGSGVTIDAKTFNAGPSVIEAMFAGQLDLSYIGPNPAINGYVQSNGEAVRVVAGATNGGAAFVVRPEAGIQSPQDLHGKKLATPQLGNTQDVALRAYLEANGMQPADKGGDVEVIPTANPEILDLFRSGEIDGAWVPEPWASRLIVDAGGELFLDERDLWPDGEFTTALIIVSTDFLNKHPDIVEAWLKTHVELTQWELANPDEAKALCNTQIEELTGKALPDAVLDEAWSRMAPTYDPLPATLLASADSAYKAGFLEERPQLAGLFNLAALNAVLKAEGLEEIQTP
jgi:NitT/TauT family transport system substrate-binding protein